MGKGIKDKPVDSSIEHKTSLQQKESDSSKTIKAKEAIEASLQKKESDRPKVIKQKADNETKKSNLDKNVIKETLVIKEKEDKADKRETETAKASISQSSEWSADEMTAQQMRQDLDFY